MSPEPDLTAEPAAAQDIVTGRAETTHECPPDGGGLTPCCGMTPFELPRTDRMTLDPSLVTCQPGPCQCMTSFAAVSPTHPGHCCFVPAAQECHAAEVAEWERQRDRRWVR